MATATRRGHGFRWNSPWLIAVLAVTIVIAATVGIGFGTGLFRFGNQSGPPVATTPTAGPTTSTTPIPSSSPTPATKVLIAVLGQQIGLKRELQLVGLDGTVVASTLVNLVVGDNLASAGGDHVAYVDDGEGTGHLYELRANGQTRDLGRLEAPSYSGIQSKVGSFVTSPDGKLWAWTTVAFDDNHPWPAGFGSPTTYTDVYLSDGAGAPSHVYHEVGDSFAALFRWTAQGPLFYRHPYSNPPVPAFHLSVGPLMIVDVASATVRSMTDDVVDIAADGTVAYANSQQGIASIRFVQPHATTTIDIDGFQDSDVQIRPRAVPTIAVLGLANTPVGDGLQRSYQTRFVDIASGKILSDPVLNARPAWRAWLPDGQILLQRWPDNAALVYSSNGSVYTVPNVNGVVVGALATN